MNTKLNPTARRQLWACYAIALAVVLAAVIGVQLLNTAVAHAEGTSQRAHCASGSTAAAIPEGAHRTPLELQLGHGERVMRDKLTSGVSYRTCNPASSLVVLYLRDSRTVAHVFYTP